MNNQDKIVEELIQELSASIYDEVYEVEGWQLVKEKIKKEIILKDKEIVLLMIEKLKEFDEPRNGINILEYCSENLKNDTEVIEKALKQEGGNLNHLNIKQKDNKDIVLMATSTSGHPIKHASDRLKNDRDFVIQVAKISGSILKYMNKQLQDDKELVLIDVKHCGMNIQYASDRLKNDKEVALVAVTKTANARNAIGEKLCNEIGSNDPQLYLKRAIDYENIKNKLSQDVDKKISIKSKI